MAELTSQTTFEVQEPIETFEETADLILLPENTGTEASRELHYPSDIFPPIIYESFPDKYENFDTIPLTARPLYQTEMTIEDSLTSKWPGYLKDRPVKETWSGRDKVSRMSAYFFRRLWEYFINPPTTGYIEWYPKDRTTKGYYVVIEGLQVGGSDTVIFDYYAMHSGYIPAEVVLTMRIMGEIP